MAIPDISNLTPDELSRLAQEAEARRWALEQTAAVVTEQLTADSRTDLPKLQQSIDELTVLLGGTATTGSLAALRSSLTNTYEVAKQRELVNLVIAETRATKRIARQVLRLAKVMAGELTSADVGVE